MSALPRTSSSRVQAVPDSRNIPEEVVEPAARAEAPAAPAAVAAQPAAEEAPAKKKGAKRFVLPVLLIGLLAGGAWYGHEWWTNGRFMISTDDAYVQGEITAIAPKVTGYVSRVIVKENQAVKAGDPLVQLDDGDYRIALQQAEAQIATQNVSLKRFDAQIDGAKAALAQAQAQKQSAVAAQSGAEIAASRAGALADKSVGTVAALDTAKVALDQAKAAVVGADANIVAAEASIATLQAQRAEAQSSLQSLQLARDKAVRDLDFTVLKAPYDGVVGNLSVQEGNLVSPGQRLAALVPVKELYVEANFKETQIAGLVPGEKVKVHVDAFEDDDIEGTVASIAPASGSVFSLLPPENATGNFTKVTQRIPVRIALPAEALDSGKLRAGLSVVVDVDSRTAPNAQSAAAQ